MKRHILSIVMTVISRSLFAQTKADAIIGEWLSSKKDSRVFIYKEGSRYYGKITWGSGSVAKDEKNPDIALRNQDLIGLIILKDFRFDGDHTWNEGSIYDPREGKTYSCKMTLKDANSLSIRGYVGISLFGRSELWTRYK